MILQEDSYFGRYDNDQTRVLFTWRANFTDPTVGHDGARIKLTEDELAAARSVMTVVPQWRPTGKGPHRQQMYNELEARLSADVDLVVLDQSHSILLATIGEEVHSRRQATELVRKHAGTICRSLDTLDQVADHMRRMHIGPIANAARLVADEPDDSSPLRTAMNLARGCSYGRSILLDSIVTRVAANRQSYRMTVKSAGLELTSDLA